MAPATLPRASSMSQSASTTLGDLPPSSSVTDAIVLAAAAMTLGPVAVDPVKVTCLTAGLATSGAPTPTPVPVTTLHTRSGSPALLSSSASISAVIGVCSAGLTTAVQPAASAG